MLARLILALPFTVYVPEKETFNIYVYNEDGYNIQIYPPIKIADQPLPPDAPDQILINKVPAFQANGLRIDFQKDNFDRSKAVQCDPSYELISQTINSFLLKLRFVTNSSKIKPINLSLLSWKLQYLNDNGSELEKTEGLVRWRATSSFTLSWTAINKNLWDEVFKLPPDYIPPQWELLLLDANDLKSEVGPSIVLAVTALEVFISHVLSRLAGSSSIPKELWAWINERNWWLKNPAIDEQFDILLKVLLGISLKENNGLWEAFKNLRDARNTFVHGGVPMIGSAPISKEDAKNLLEKAKQIINYIKSKLPQELQWPEYKHDIKVDATKKLSVGK